jgi:hypothetical protein
MKILMNASWVLGPILQLTLLSFMLQRKLNKTLPRFFSYILFQVIKSAFLFGIHRFSSADYFDAYWTGNAISVILAVGVMDELLHLLFQQYGGIQALGTLIFRWACGVVLLLAIIGAFFGEDAAAERIVGAVLSFDRSVRLMQCGIFFLLLLLSRSVQNFWRERVFGVALGFGIFASVELILVNVVFAYTNVSNATVSLVQSLTYNGITVLWIAYLAPRRETVSVSDRVAQISYLGIPLQPPVKALPGSDSFIAVVENAVERVLSRSSWPRPSTLKNSQIIGRKPEPEQLN